MMNKINKFLSILIVHVLVIFVSMNALAKSDNHVLSLIHAENNYDYYTWKELNNSPLKNIKNNRNILKKIIVNSWDRKDKIFINESFIYNVISNLNKLIKENVKKLNIKIQIYNPLKLHILMYLTVG